MAALTAEPWARYAQVIDLSAKHPVISPEVNERLSTRLERSDRDVCRYDLAQSRFRVAQALLQNARRIKADYIDEADRHAQASLRAALVCDPMNGRLWYELSAAEYGRGVQADRLLGLLNFSEAVSPIEAAMMIQRAALTTDLIGRPELGQDRRRLAEFIRALQMLFPGDALRLLRGLDRVKRPEIVQILLAQLPEEKRTMLEGSLARERAADAEKDRPFMFTPFGEAARPKP